MEELNKKIIWNAVSAYFLVFISIALLMGKGRYINHNFVKNHAKSAFILHISLWIILFVMSYGFFESITVFTYSVNTIITAILVLMVFSGILFGMYKAHKWETVTLWEMFHHASSWKKYVTKNKSEDIQESDAIIMILSHIPFLGYIVGTRNSDMPHMRDILQLNFLVTLTAVLLLIVGYSSLASLLMLAYIIYWVAQSIFLVTQGSIASFWLDGFPTVEEKYILQKTTIRYILNTLNKKIFVPFKDIRARKSLQRIQDEKDSELHMKSPYTYIARNIIILAILFIACAVYFGWNSPVLILFLFPITYLIWHSERKAYKMPYIYDIYAAITYTINRIKHIFSRAKTLKNTTTKETIKMPDKNTETKKES